MFAVFDVVYPVLADLLARAGGIPQLSLILSTQMARLAIASLSYHTPPLSPISNGSPGFVLGHGQGGAGNGYWELVVECLCSSYSRTVSRMKDLPVELDTVKSSISVRNIFFSLIYFLSYIYCTRIPVCYTPSLSLSLSLSLFLILSLSFFHFLILKYIP